MSTLKVGPICRELEELEMQGAGMDRLLSRAMEMLHESSTRFDWTGIYELHADNTLRLGPYVGAPTEHVAITVGDGVCGTAVARKCNMNIPDVTKAPSYLACSAQTKSELVVLIRQGSRIHAQIDIDSHELDAFDDEVAQKVEQLADWLSRAYERRLQATRAVGHASE